MSSVLQFFGLGLFVAGLFFMIFRRGRRLIGFGAFVAGTVVIGLSQGQLDQAAIDAGFADAADMREAQSAGVNDAAVWAAERAEREAEAVKAAAAQAAAEAAADKERRRSGFHCLSEWDGAHVGVKGFVRERMREPDSFEHIETRITPVSEAGIHLLFMDYRARNGFGGMNVATATAEITNSNCTARVTSLE